MLKILFSIFKKVMQFPSKVDIFAQTLKEQLVGSKVPSFSFGNLTVGESSRSRGKIVTVGS